MGKAAKQAKNNRERVQKQNILHSVKGSLQEALSGTLGDEILDELRKEDGRI